MSKPDLVEITELQSIRGVSFAAGVSFRQLIVTGPPGTGKTTLIAKIGGWPDEGFIDLTQGNWWRSRLLAYRPRQIHLGIPFEDHPDALTMFEREWVESAERPRLELDRIALPPLGRRRNPWKHRRKYVFEFLLPSAAEVFEARKLRSDRRSHLIDAAVSLDHVREQLDVYWEIARHFHRFGMQVFVRDGFDVPPKVIAEAVEDPGREAARPRVASRTGGRSWLHHYVRSMTANTDRIVDRSRRAHLAGSRATIARHVLPVDIVTGSQKLRVYAERLPDAMAELWPQSVRVFDSGEYFSGIAHFHRLTAGKTIRLGRRADALTGTPPNDVSFPRVEIVNDGDFIGVADLESPTGTTVIPLADPLEIDRLDHDRIERLERVRRLLGNLPPAMDTAKATDNLRAAIDVLRRNPWRPEDSRGEPGGLVELPDDVVPVIVGDLHANLDNLLIILSEGRFLDALERGDAAFVLLGDAAHPEEGTDLSEMDSSIEIMDTIIALMARFGPHFLYLRGNHDSFSADVTKQGINQGRLWKEAIEERRGKKFLNLMKRFYELLPYVVAGRGFIACHAGPPMEALTRKKLIDIHRHPHFVYQLTWNRIQSPRSPGGYSKRDVRSLQKALGMKKSAAVIVSHNPREGEDTAIVELGGIKGHHLVYSARRDRVSIFTSVAGAIVPLTYGAWPISARARPDPDRD